MLRGSCYQLKSVKKTNLCSMHSGYIFKPFSIHFHTKKIKRKRKKAFTDYIPRIVSQQQKKPTQKSPLFPTTDSSQVRECSQGGSPSRHTAFQYLGCGGGVRSSKEVFKTWKLIKTSSGQRFHTPSCKPSLATRNH